MLNPSATPYCKDALNPMNDKKDFKLDEQADKLFQSLDITSEDEGPLYGALPSLTVKETELDAWRALLIEAAHIIASHILEKQLREGVKKEPPSFARLEDVFRKISDIPIDVDIIQICHRGFTSSASRTGELDYELVFGEIMIDLSVAQSMAKRMGVRMSHLDKRLLKAFEVLSNHSINSLDIHIPDPDSVRQMEDMQLCLLILSRYHQASKMSGPLRIEQDGETRALPLVQNHLRQYDPNLTMLAGLNRLSQAAMQKIVKNTQDAAEKGDVSLKDGIYSAIVAAKTAKGKLKRPSLEVNTSQYEIVRAGRQRRAAARSNEHIPIDVQNHKRNHKKVDAGENIEEIEEMLSEEPNDRLTQLIRENFSQEPQQAKGMIKGVYGNDYKRINAQQLANRIYLVSRLLDAIEKHPEGEKILKEVLNHIEGRIEQVSESVLGDIAVQDGVLKVRVGGKEGSLGKINPKLVKTLAASKSRVSIRKKMRNLVRGKTQFSARDYKALADDFDIPVKDAKDIVELLKRCFNEEGQFLRKTFEANIPAFTRWERRIFEFMWHYLKGTFRRQDRVAFLNSLQHMIASMKQPQQAISVLMTDFLKNPTIVSFSDRNAIMLSNLLIRKYNKELNLDIEMTPEEVLLVREGVDRKITSAVSKVLDASQDRFMRKMRTIRNYLRIVLGGVRADTSPMPLRYLITLEREVYIFLALLEGRTAHRLLRSAANTYGDPSADIYRLKDSRKNLITLMQHLKVILRALGRIGTETDLTLLDRINNSDQGFMRLATGNQEEDKVRQVLRWAELSRETILKRTMKDSRDTEGFMVIR
jgi:hypothetical protein